MKIKNRNKIAIQRFIKYFLGPLLFLWLASSIYQQIANTKGLEQFWEHIVEGGWSKGGILILIFILMIVNWMIEAMKWKLAVQKIQTIKFFVAFKAVLSGVSFSVSTPNRVGEYLGRVLYMEEGKRLKAVSLTIAGSMSQLLVTLTMGVIALSLLKARVIEAALMSEFWLDTLIYGTIAAVLVLTVFYFRLSWLVKWIDRSPKTVKFRWLIVALEEFNATLLVQLLSLSVLRFLVFVVQYYLAYRLFEVQLGFWENCWAMSLSFLVLAVIPTITIFTDLVFRGQVTLKIIGLFSQNFLGIEMATLSIWLINLIIPALTGSLLILSLRRIFKDKSELTAADSKNDILLPLNAEKEKNLNDEWNS